MTPSVTLLWRSRAVALVVHAMALLAVLTQSSVVARAADSPPNVILLLVDTLRADRMSVYGYGRTTTPALAGRAQRAVVFERARSQSACTPTSVSSLLTSRYPAEIFQGRRMRFGIPDGVRSLAEILQTGGWRTIALSASEIVRKNASKLNPRGGFGRGFDVFDDEACEKREAGFLHERALKHLDGVEDPFFLYIHYMDPHHPYQPPSSHQRQFLTRDLSKEPAWLLNGNPDPIERLILGRAQEGDAAARLEQVPVLADLYDEEILYLDGEIDRFLETLEDRGLLENSIVILASDHGEMFLEQGDLKHCLGVWDTVTRTPLVIWAPGVVAGRRVRGPVENLDIVPTLLDYLGLRGEGLRGESLRPLLEGAPDEPRLAFSTQSLLRSVDDGRFKLILNIETGATQLYDLRADPFERTDLSTSHREVTQRLTLALDEWLKSHGERRGGAQTVERSKRVEERLRALGYLQ